MTRSSYVITTLLAVGVFAAGAIVAGTGADRAVAPAERASAGGHEAASDVSFDVQVAHSKNEVERRAGASCCQRR